MRGAQVDIVGVRRDGQRAPVEILSLDGCPSAFLHLNIHAISLRVDARHLRDQRAFQPARVLDWLAPDRVKLPELRNRDFACRCPKDRQ